jgi:hypothetical protein
MKTSLVVLNTIICLPQEPTSVGQIVTKRNGIRRLMLNSSHCTENMYHAIHAQISHIFSWINVLDMNRPFNWKRFKMKLIWGLQSWTLDRHLPPILHRKVTWEIHQKDRSKDGDRVPEAPEARMITCQCSGVRSALHPLPSSAIPSLHRLRVQTTKVTSN